MLNCGMTLFDLSSAILYEDAEVLVLNKPSGLLVHPVAPDSVALTQYLTDINPNYRPAHRLDRDTSGCLVVGKSAAALKKLGRFFMQRRVDKVYLAVVSPLPPAPSGHLSAPLLKKNARMVVDPSGQLAETAWQQLDNGLMHLSPLTGRTHQLRAHMAHLGCPIIGDSFYGGLPAPRLMLHASQITLPHLPPITAPLPSIFEGYFSA